MRRWLSLLVPLCLVLSFAMAQQPAAPPADPAAQKVCAEQEAKLQAHAAAALGELADGWQQAKQHARALALRRELLLEYAPDDAKARDKCGFTKVGDAWRADANKVVIDKDLKGDAKLIKKLEQQQKALDKELLAGHRALAEAWTRAGAPERAIAHWQRVRRWVPDDTAAAAGLALREFEAFRGSPTELAMLRRARTIRGAAEWLQRRHFPVAPIAGREHPLLAQAKIAHVGVKSEHFEFWGTLSPAQLTVLAEYAERSLLLCDTLLGTSEGELFAPKRVQDFVLLREPAQYAAVLDQVAAQFDKDRLAFLKNDVDFAFVQVGDEVQRIYKARLGDEADRDQVVRGVVQDAVGVLTEGLWEGLGHAACGYFFDKTLTFLLEQAHERTSAGGTQKPLLPDLETWRKIAEESAWAKSDTRTSELVLVSAAKFTAEQRVKAWAMCDYLMHTRPELLRQLDESQSPARHTPPEVEAEFLRRTGVNLAELDTAWRELWSRGEALRKAMRADPVGDEKAKDHAARVAARGVVDLVDEARLQLRRGPLGFYLGQGGDVATAATYVEQLVKAQQLQKKNPKLVVELPQPPALLGRTVLWADTAEPAVAVATWLQHPALRDTLLHPGRGLLGAAQAKQGWLLDLDQPVASLQRGAPQAWPVDGAVDVPAAARVADLGARVAAALAAAGHTDAVVGMPVTLHFWRPMPGLGLQRATCRVGAAGGTVDGVVVACQSFAHGGESVRQADGSLPDDPADASADGSVAFVPFAPLPAGEVSVRWTLPPGLLERGQEAPTVRFTAK